MTKWAGSSIFLGVLLIVCGAAGADGGEARPLQTLVEVESLADWLLEPLDVFAGDGLF